MAEAVVEPFDWKVFGGQPGHRINLHNPDVTCGEWRDEAASAQAFDAAVADTTMFNLYREVTGDYIYLRPNQKHKKARIDRVLIPTPRLISLGWTIGAIGVELKKSGVNTGPAFGQTIDYSRVAWDIEGVRIMTERTFLWPVGRLQGIPQSVVGGQSCGTAFLDWHGVLTFATTSVLAKFDPDGPDIRQHNFTSGRKTGSR